MAAKAHRKEESLRLNREAIARQAFESKRAAARLEEEVTIARLKRQQSDAGGRLTTQPVLASKDEALRFRIGDRVDVNLGNWARKGRTREHEWQTASVVSLHYHPPAGALGHVHFPPHYTYPYLVKFEAADNVLEGLTEIAVPCDDKNIIRRHKETSATRQLDNTHEQKRSIIAREPREKKPQHDNKESRRKRSMPRDLHSVIVTAIRQRVMSTAIRRAQSKSSSNRRDETTQADSSPSPAFFAHDPSAAAAVDEDDPFTKYASSMSSDELAWCRAALAITVDAYEWLPMDHLSSSTASTSNHGNLCARLAVAIGSAGEVPAPYIPGKPTTSNTSTTSTPTKATTPKKMPSSSPSSSGRASPSTSGRASPAPPSGRASPAPKEKDKPISADTLAANYLATAVIAPHGSAEASAAQIATLAATAVNHALARQHAKATKSERTSNRIPIGDESAELAPAAIGSPWKRLQTLNAADPLDRLFNAPKNKDDADGFLLGRRGVGFLQEAGFLDGAGGGGMDGFLQQEPQKQQRGKSGGGGRGSGAVSSGLKNKAFIDPYKKKKESISESGRSVGRRWVFADRRDSLQKKDSSSMDVLDRMHKLEGERIKAVLNLDGRVDRTVSGLETERQQLNAVRWDDDEMIRLSTLLERGELKQLESLDIQSPNTIGTRGLKAFCRALLIGESARSLVELRVRADSAIDEDMFLLAATLSARDTRKEMMSAPKRTAPMSHVVIDPSKEDENVVVAFVAAPQLYILDLEQPGNAKISAHAQQAVAAACRARKAIAPISEADLERIVNAAKMPAPLTRFRASIDYGDGVSASMVEKRDALFADWDGNGSGAISLNELGTGLLKTLSLSYGKGANKLYHRYYRSYIRAFNDARAGIGGPDEEGITEDGGAISKLPLARRDAYVTRRAFRRLLLNLATYSIWYEVFALIDGGTRGVTAEDDHRISKSEWVRSLEKVRAAGRSWAPYQAFKNAHASDFEVMDRDKGGFLTLEEFFKYVRAAELALDANQHQDGGGGGVSQTATTTTMAKPTPVNKAAAAREMAAAKERASQFVVKKGRLYTKQELALEEAEAIAKANEERRLKMEAEAAVEKAKVEAEVEEAGVMPVEFRSLAEAEGIFEDWLRPAAM